MIPSCFPLCFSLLIIPNHWDYDLCFPVTFYISHGPAVNPFPDLLTYEKMDPIVLVSFLHLCSRPFSIFTAFLLIPFSTPKLLVLRLFSSAILLISIPSLKSLVSHVPCYRTNLYTYKVLRNLFPSSIHFQCFLLSFSFLFYIALKAFPYQSGCISLWFIACIVPFLLYIANTLPSFPMK